MKVLYLQKVDVSPLQSDTFKIRPCQQGASAWSHVAIIQYSLDNNWLYYWTQQQIKSRKQNDLFLSLPSCLQMSFIYIIYISFLSAHSSLIFVYLVVFVFSCIYIHVYSR